jgi:hypothetical protein
MFVRKKIGNDSNNLTDWQFHFVWVPCLNAMVHPQVAVGGDSLQIWRVAVNIFNR